MPANLTPEYHDAEERCKSAVTVDEKVAALEEMLRVIPKHKGTEKMQADLKRRLARTRKDAQKQKSSGAAAKPFYHVEREGAGRVVLCGPPNSGKSQTVASLTAAHVEVADYPYTTRAPQPGMMQFEDIQIQLVDMPPLAPEVLEAWQLAIIEQADLDLLLFDMTDPNLLEETEFVLQTFEKRSLSLMPPEESQVIVLANKVDLPGAEANLAAWRELFEGRLDPVPFSAVSEADLASLKRVLFDRLEIVRVYTKAPGSGREKDPVPYVLDKGSTVLDAAAAIHKDLAEDFKFARIWGTDKYDGQMVERDYVLQDGDLLEVHA